MSDATPAPQSPTLSILIVSFNTRDLTLACLRSVYEQTTTPAEVVVVDNASNDGSADEIARAFPGVRLIRSAENLGFARANNLAADEARGKYVVLLNPDTVVLDHALDKLHSFMEAHPEVGACGGRTLFADGTLNPTSCWGRPTLWSSFARGIGLSALFPRSRLFDPEALAGWRRDSTRDVDIVTGCLLVLRRDLWRSLGGFDPRFHMYGEDFDLCLRIRAAGRTCCLLGDATIIHHGGASERVRADKIVRLFTAKALLFRKHWSPARAGWGIRTLDLWAGTRLVANGLVRWASAARAAEYRAWRAIWARRAEWRGAGAGGAAAKEAGVRTGASEPRPEQGKQ